MHMGVQRCSLSAIPGAEAAPQLSSSAFLHSATGFGISHWHWANVPFIPPYTVHARTLRTMNAEDGIIIIIEESRGGGVEVSKEEGPTERGDVK